MVGVPRYGTFTTLGLFSFVVNAAMFSTGQKCTATSRAIVEQPIYDRFVEALTERTNDAKR